MVRSSASRSDYGRTAADGHLWRIAGSLGSSSRGADRLRPVAGQGPAHALYGNVGFLFTARPERSRTCEISAAPLSSVRPPVLPPTNRVPTLPRPSSAACTWPAEPARFSSARNEKAHRTALAIDAPATGLLV